MISTKFSVPCTAAILDGSDVIYIARSQPERVMTMNLGVGARLPAYYLSPRLIRPKSLARWKSSETRDTPT
ncbi:hypothetical protein [Cupriavidus pinatubonensis]|uniref:hypothetical protein n=1 Tax=Cupriavidus pinatubonensis TaxID=248026 RepID=UPI001128645E|nr:hypothetical protein [Cupriavidus pinatubonensis]